MLIIGIVALFILPQKGRNIAKLPPSSTSQITQPLSFFLFDITVHEWLDNINDYQYSEAGPPPIELSDVTTDGEGGYIIEITDSIAYLCSCSEDDRIFKAKMVGHGDGTEEGAIILMSAIVGFIYSFHPEYTTDQISDVIDGLFTLNEAKDAFVKTTVEADGTYFTLEVEDGILVVTASAVDFEEIK